MSKTIEKLIEKYDYCRLRLVENDGAYHDVWAVPTSQEYSDRLDSDQSHGELVMFVVIDPEVRLKSIEWLGVPVWHGMPVVAYTCGENLPEASFITAQENIVLTIDWIMDHE